MAVVDLAVIARGPNGLHDEIIGESKLATQAGINPQETPQGPLGWIRFSSTQLTIEVRLGDAALLRLDQGIDHPGRRIDEPLITTDHRWRQRLLAQTVLKDHVGVRLVEAGAGCGQLRAVRGHGLAAPLQIATHHLVEVLVFDRGVRNPLGRKNVVEVLLCGGA